MRKVIKKNGYNENTIRKELKQTISQEKTEDQDYVSDATLPYIRGAADRIGRILNIQITSKRHIRMLLGTSKIKIVQENQHANIENYKIRITPEALEINNRDTLNKKKEAFKL